MLTADRERKGILQEAVKTAIVLYSECPLYEVPMRRSSLQFEHML